MNNRELLLQAFEAMDRDMKPIMEMYEKWYKKNFVHIMYQAPNNVHLATQYEHDTFLACGHPEPWNYWVARWIIKPK